MQRVKILGGPCCSTLKTALFQDFVLAVTRAFWIGGIETDMKRRDLLLLENNCTTQTAQEKTVGNLHFRMGVEGYRWKVSDEVETLVNANPFLAKRRSTLV